MPRTDKKITAADSDSENVNGVNDMPLSIVTVVNNLIIIVFYGNNEQLRRQTYKIVRR